MPSHLRLAIPLAALAAASFAGVTARAASPTSRSKAIHEARFTELDRLAEEAVAAKNVPGVVFVVGHRGKVVYRRAFGNRWLKPETRAMTPDTVFDLASLTKVVATTSSIMALVEDGRLRLTDPVVRHWPEWGQNGKDKVTLRHLLTHTSGLAAWDNYQKQFGDMQGAVIQDHREKILPALAAATLKQEPGAKFVYSDLGFITLGEIVRRVSGEPLDQFARKRVFMPLGMKETGFNPQGSLRDRAAPTQLWKGVFMQGEVHDPNAEVLGGVAGHAGLFSTADDLARFAPMLLSADRPEGNGGKRYPLSPATVRLMTTPAAAPGGAMRGLGWDIDSSYSHVKGDLMPLGSFGHTGFTGTYLWVDPYSQTYLIGLSNRVHPDGGGSPLRLWAMAANIVCSSVGGEALPPRPPVFRPLPE